MHNREPVLSLLSSPLLWFTSLSLSPRRLMDSSPMAETDASAAPPSVSAPSSSSKENLAPLTSRIAELKESKADLLGRIQGLKKDLQDWRSKLDTQVKTYREELTDLKKTLIVEVEQLKSEFQELRNTLQQQQDDVANSLNNLTMKETPEVDATDKEENK
ncbi:uncharacterized protein LOC116261801 isoform X2 [Nymphaea colorata]|uniref:uncharacterized protein LOC116261801 isoform X2 n=1 Tax=Nymphaea colorata TaxID=210225 RepID=UPI00129EC2D4|nr:uncharacterized protein LOC116261801 isoform X2 [Nymphaea colorata]